MLKISNGLRHIARNTCPQEMKQKTLFALSRYRFAIALSKGVVSSLLFSFGIIMAHPRLSSEILQLGNLITIRLTRLLS